MKKKPASQENLLQAFKEASKYAGEIKFMADLFARTLSAVLAPGSAVVVAHGDPEEKFVIENRADGGGIRVAPMSQFPDMAADPKIVVGSRIQIIEGDEIH